MQAVQYVHELAVPLAFRMLWNQVIQTMHALVLERWEQPATLSLDAPECLDLQRNCAGLANQLDAMLSSLPNELAKTVVSPPAAK